MHLFSLIYHTSGREFDSSTHFCKKSLFIDIRYQCNTTIIITIKSKRFLVEGTENTNREAFNTSKNVNVKDIRNVVDIDLSNVMK